MLDDGVRQREIEAAILERQRMAVGSHELEISHPPFRGQFLAGGDNAFGGF